MAVLTFVPDDRDSRNPETKTAIMATAAVAAAVKNTGAGKAMSHDVASTEPDANSTASPTAPMTVSRLETAERPTSQASHAADGCYADGSTDLVRRVSEGDTSTTGAPDA